MRKVTTLLASALLATACADAPSPEGDEAPAATVSADDEGGTEYAPYDPDGKADGLNLPRGPLVFDQACAEGERITIAAVGDVLLHGPLQQQAYASATGFRSLWHEVEDLLQRADVTYANFEGPAAQGVTATGREARDPGPVFDGTVYGSYPMFNYHPRLVDDLLASGVDVVSTANNHSLDRRALGADRTLDKMEQAGLKFTGTRKAGESEADRPWYTVTDVKGVKLAWLACTFGTNGIPDTRDQVLLCFEDADRIEALVRELAGRADLDAVLVTPHWGEEYQAMPNRQQVALAHRLLDAGALAIIAAHPHVLQPWERHVTPDGRETFVIYSLGNFVSGQSHLPRRSTLLLYLGLTRKPDGTMVVNGARYLPLHMTNAASRSLQAIDRVGGLSDSRALTVGMFGEWNLMPPDAPLVTNPQCDPTWTPPAVPHAHDGWIGGACESADACGGVECLDNLPGGLCTLRCERTCPDQAGRAVTFCADLGYDDGGVCVNRCTRDADCRTGYACREVQRFGDGDTIRTACVPAQ